MLCSPTVRDGTVYTGSAKNAVHAFRTAVEEVKAGNYGIPETVAPITDAYADAIDTLQMTWEGEPRALRLALDWPATEAVFEVLSEFHEDAADTNDGKISKSSVSETYGGLVYAYHYATYVPPAAGHLLDVLQGH